ncbi:Xyloglucan endotransglycosylase 6 [Hibiscus syriacus]|uniref:S-protein homolog n=1 Tax=Hibiscus syriacus TaxID=106335 RepID=A0A6A2Z663_HIBSY|nr:Xyloglucan endotransglycosylase 6 [Hibiscus syriacus]
MSSLDLGVIFLLALLARFEPSSGVYLGRRHVNVINKLENREMLMIHCWWNSDDMGTRNLEYDEEFKTAFMDVFTFQHANIGCDMEFKDGGMTRKGHFLLYDTSLDVRTRECYKWCNWAVGTYGLYAYDEIDNKWDYEIPWPSNDRGVDEQNVR